MNVLTVEDNEINARLMDHILNDLGLNIKHTVVEDADGAINITKDQIFDLILMDINLGDDVMDGTQIMKKLRESSEYLDVPIFAVTCYSLPGDKERFINEGFDRHFPKPIDRDDLMTAIKEVVQVN